jgi:hypothetical protein
MSQQSEQPNLSKVGYFHFGNRAHGSDGFKALRATLEMAGHESVRDSLIVLPEAFNLRGDYRPRTDDDEISLDLLMVPKLRRLSQAFDISFVAGLIESIGCRVTSSAYVVSASKCDFLATKVGDDGTGIYEWGLGINDQIVSHRGVYIASQICMDSALEETAVISR